MDINTENIEEAVVVTETKKDTQAEDLLARLSKQTAVKEPGKTEERKTTNSFWDSSADDFEEPAEKKTEPAASKDEKNTKTASKPLDDKSFHNSASNAVFFVEFATEGLCKMAVNRKFKKRFTKEEKEALYLIADADPKDLKEADKKLHDKYLKLTKKKEDTLEKLPFTDNETDIMEDAFFRLCKQRNIEIPPEAAVLMSVLTCVGSRVMDVAFD